MLFKFEKQYKLVDFMSLTQQMGYKCTVIGDLLVDIPIETKGFAEFYSGKPYDEQPPKKD